MRNTQLDSSEQRNRNEIGSHFYFSETKLQAQDKACVFFDEANIYLSTCRSAIDLILSKVNLQNLTAMIPAFTCQAVVEPFTNRGYTVIPYSVNANFSTDPDTFLNEATRAQIGVILIHDYFGFDSNAALRESNVLEKLREQGIVIIVDRTHSMFSNYQQLRSEYYVGSIRKWLGIPDGAITNLYCENLNEDTELATAKVRAMIYKESYIYRGLGEKNKVLELYRQAEDVLNSRKTAYAMSNISRKLLRESDLEGMCIRRKVNYRVLSTGISESMHIAIPHKCLGEDEVPFYFPVFVKHSRKRFQSYLANNNVYATVIWGCPKELINNINETAEGIYREILCIPCDQRYEVDDMNYICELVNKYSFSKEIEE